MQISFCRHCPNAPECPKVKGPKRTALDLKGAEMPNDHPGAADSKEGRPGNGDQAGRRPKKPTSERKVNANRSNAKKSTGPKTDEGKARVARNAVNHGVFISRLEPILGGQFKEDPEEFWGTANALIDSLRPRDAIELATAARIAGLYIAFDRLESFGSASIEGHTGGHPRARTRRIAKEVLRDNAERLAECLEGLQPFETDDYETFARLIRDHGPDPDVSIKELWDEGHQPQSAADWESAFQTLKLHFWLSDDDARRWAMMLGLRVTVLLHNASEQERMIGASQVLRDSLEYVTRYQARLGRELDRLVTLYRALQDRNLGPGKTNPPRHEYGEEE